MTVHVEVSVTGKYGVRKMSVCEYLQNAGSSLALVIFTFFTQGQS